MGLMPCCVNRCDSMSQACLDCNACRRVRPASGTMEVEPSRAMSLDDMPDQVEVADTGPEESEGTIPMGATTAGAHVGHLSELSWPELGGLDLTKVHRFALPKGKRKKTRTSKDEHYDVVISNSPYGKFVGPSPVRPQITPAQIARKRMEKVYQRLGMAPPGRKGHVKPGGPDGKAAASEGPAAGVTGSGAMGQDSQTVENFADLAEFFRPQTLQSWLAEVDGLRVALDRSLSNETATGEVTYPLLQEMPQVFDAVKAQVKAYALPKYKHGEGRDEAVEQAAGQAEGGGATAATSVAMATTATALATLSVTGDRTGDQPQVAGSVERAAARPLPAAMSPLAVSGKDLGMARAASPTAGSPKHALSPSASKPLSPMGRTGPMSPKSPSRGGAVTPMSRGGQRRRREENETRPSSRARLSTFLDSLEAAHVLSRDDVNNFFAPLPLEPSSEMDEQMKEVLERHLGTGPWQDIVASNLARPLDSELVYCDEAAQLGKATVAVRLGSPREEGEGEEGEAVHLTVHSSMSSTLPIIENFPRTEYLQRLAEDHRREGRIQEAIACLQEASALLEQKQVILPMAQAGQLFPYSNETFRAARLIQRLGRQRMRRKHAASTLISSRFRGFLARRGGLLLRVKRKVGAKLIQHKYRAHLRRRIRAAISVQKIARGWKGRRDVAQLRKEIKGAVVLQALFRMFKAKLRVKALRYQQVCAVRLQSLYRGFFVRLVRHRQISLLHMRWARCATAVNRHVRGWLGRRQAALDIRRRIAAEFDRRQAELDVLRASTLLSSRRCHWYLQTAEGKTEVTREKQRLKASGRFRRTTLAPFQLVDNDHLMAGLRPLFELYDVAGSGYLCRTELHGLLRFLGIRNRDAEATAALLLSDEQCWRRLSFQDFCVWYHNYFRFSPDSLLSRFSHRLQRMSMPFAQRTILRRRCLQASRDVSHDTHQLQPAPPLQCIQCRRPFLHYRAFMDHFVGAPDEAVHGPRHLCPVTGGIGLISLGYLGGRQAFAFQRRVNTELMRHLDETAALELASHAAEAKALADLGLPQPRAELDTLICALQVAHPPATLRRNARRDAVQPRLLPGQLRHQKRFVIGHNAPRARRLVAPINRHLGFAYLRRKRALAKGKQEAVRRRHRALRVRRALKRLVARRPCPRPVVQAVFDVYCIDKRGLHVRDLRDLCAALQLRFTWEAKALLTPLSLKATFAPGPATRVDFDTFYRWYVASNGLLFHNGFKVSRAKMPHYLARCLLLRRAVQTARAAAIDDFRKKRPARMEWSASELCTLEQHARRHPEFRCLLPDTDQDLTHWLHFSRDWAVTQIQALIREKWAPRSRGQPWWQRVLCGRRGIAVGSDAAPLAPTAVVPVYVAGLGLRHAEAEARRYLTTVYGKMVQRLQVDTWQLEAMREQRKAAPTGCGRPGLLRSFLQARREKTGLPTPGGEEREARPLRRLAGVLVTHDPDGHGRVLWETVPQLVQDLDLSAEPPGVSYEMIQKLSYLRSNQLRPTRSHVEEGQRVSDSFSVWADDLYEALRQGLTSGVPLRRRGRRFPDASLLTSGMWWRNRAARSFLARGRMTAAQASPLAEALNARTAQVKTEAEREWLSRDARGLARKAFAEAVSRPEARLLVKSRVLYLEALRSAYAKVGVRRGERRRWWVVDYCFHLLDPERRGYIDAWQLGTLFETLGLHMGRHELTLLVESVLDPHGSGRVALADLQAWLQGDGRRHYRSMRSRLLQLWRRLREALGMHLRGDAIFSLQMETLRDRERALRSLFACEDGDVAALRDIKPWNRSQPLRCERDLHTLLSLESVSSADVHLLLHDTELGPILTEAHRRQLEGRREALLRVEEDAAVRPPGILERLRSWWHFMKRPTSQHEEALAKHSDEILGVEASYALSDRLWLEKAGARLKRSHLSKQAWTRDSIETTIHRSTVATSSSYSGVQRLLDAKDSIVPAHSCLARLSWAHRVRKTGLEKLWRHDELQQFLALSHGLCYELAGLRPVKDDTEANARADILLRMQAAAQLRADALLKTFLCSFRGRQELRELEQTLECKWEGPLALQPTAHAFTLLGGHVEQHAVHACDVPLVVHFIFGRCKRARALMHWVNGITLSLRLSDSGMLSMGLLQALCEGSPFAFSPSTRYVRREYTPRNFVALILSLHFRQKQRSAISHAVTEERIVNEFFTQAQTFLSEVKDE